MISIDIETPDYIAMISGLLGRCPHCGFRDARFWHWEEQLPRGKRFYCARIASDFVGEELGFQRSYDYLRIPRVGDVIRTRRYLRYSNLLFQLMEDGSLCSVSC